MIKKGYRLMAKKYHPDAGGQKSADMFSKVNDAYKTLSDPQKRQVYDGSRGGGGRGPIPGAGSTYGTQQAAGFEGWENMNFGYAGKQGAATQGMNLNKMWEDIFGSGQADGRNDPRKSKFKPQKGGDITVPKTISFKQAVDGCVTEVSYSYLRRCIPCKGTGSKDGQAVSKCNQCGGRGKMSKTNGYYHVEQPCPTCNGVGEMIRTLCGQCGGSGTVKDRTTQQVTIPAGVNTRDRLRVGGKGESGTRGGTAGNLFIDVTVEEDPHFIRDADDIHHIKPITVTQAILGAKVILPTISGDVSLTVPKGTQQGDSLILRGKGVKKPQSTSCGNMYVHFHIVMPSSLTPKQRAAMEHFAEDEQPVDSSSQILKSKEQFRKLINFKEPP
eukprot:TRINITY_DN3117_c0_g1_i1.p1 TRINITY_DN3117_c0_g1~~TRINITY_DN3117_c0_g1_i1.p1  ORF type:complete len:442 (+),score=56.44 TRINITY_DN3117_c0_g1_i1:172-1326(+)